MEVAGGKGPSSEGYVEVRMRILILFMTDLGVDTLNRPFIAFM